MVELILFCALASAAWAIGRLTLRQFMGGKGIPGETSFSIAIGLGVFSILTLALGLMGILYTWVLYLVLGSSLLLIPFTVKRKWVATLSFSVFPKLVRGIRQAGLVYALIAAILIVELLSALAPPTDPDALSLHLLRAKYLLERHRIDFSTTNFQFQYPSFMVCLYTFGMGLYNDRVAQLIHLLTMIMALMGLHTFARRKGGKSLASITVLFFLFIPMVNYQASTGLVDVGLASYEILALIALLYWEETESNIWIFLSGTMTGFALGIKYSGLFAFVINISLILYVGFRKRLRRPFPQTGSTIFSYLTLYILPALCIPSFWYIKNLVMFSNPFYPLLSEVFSFLGLTPAYGPGYEWWNFLLKNQGSIERNIKNLLILPWIITMPAYRIPLNTGTVPIFYLTLLPGLLLVRNIPGWIKTIFAYCGAFLIIWFFFGLHIGRFIITPLALLSLPTAFSALKLIRGRKPLKITALSVIILSVVVSLGTLAYKKGDSALTGAGMFSDRQFLERTVRSFPAVQYILENSPNAKVIVFLDNQAEYYLGRKHLSFGAEDPSSYSFDYWYKMSPEAMKKRLKNTGVTHILVNEYSARNLWIPQMVTPEARKRFEIVIREKLEMAEKLRRIASRTVLSLQGVSLYEVGR